jgi:hypothetical protein
VTGARRAERRIGGSVVLVLALVGLVLTIVLFTGTRDDPPSTRQPAPAPSSSAVPSPAVTSEEQFCAEFRRLAAAQTEFTIAPDRRGSELLREAADRLVAVGLPATMTLPARSGYFTLIEGIYQSLGLTLDPASVGALDEPVEGGDDAFSSYLIQYCPA